MLKFEKTPDFDIFQACLKIFGFKIRIFDEVCDNLILYVAVVFTA